MHRRVEFLKHISAPDQVSLETFGRVPDVERRDPSPSGLDAHDQPIDKSRQLTLREKRFTGRGAGGVRDQTQNQCGVSEVGEQHVEQPLRAVRSHLRRVTDQ